MCCMWTSKCARLVSLATPATRGLTVAGRCSDWKAAATAAMERVGEFVHQLNTTPELGALFSRLVEDEAAMAQLTEEQQRVAIMHNDEFRGSGTTLPRHARERLVALQVEVDRLRWQFTQNSHRHSEHDFTVPEFDLEDLPAECRCGLRGCSRCWCWHSHVVARGQGEHSQERLGWRVACAECQPVAV